MFDDAFLSHAIMWLIGAMSLCSVGLLTAALFSMGRSGQRKN